MSRLFLPIFFFLLANGLASRLPPPVLTGIQTNHDYTVDELVRDIFIKGDCQNVSNIKAIGNSLSIGYFQGGDNIFGFAEGVLLSSGDIALAEGPNVSVESSKQFGDNTGDPDINLFASNAVFDVAGIEFDFVPVGNTVTFRYVFASEEYCEFVGSIFNDVFGFFVSGPGINGPFANNAINVALVPGTTDYVAINAINHNTNQAFYIRNELPMDANQCGIPHQPTFQDAIGYDGMTIPLTATIAVVPCETYRIRLLVADVGDDKLDSGVFLKAESFDLGPGVSVRAEVTGSNSPVAVEGCRNGQFVFTRSGPNTNQPLTVNFSIDPASTAESGADYAPIPTSITIPAGQNSAVLPVTVLADGLPEPQETLILSLFFPCDCQAPLSATLFISDEADIELENAEINVCAGQSFTIGPIIVSGTGPFSFLWQDGTTTPTITTSVSQNTHFTVTVTDACGATAPAIAAAIIQPVPNAVISGEIFLCNNQPGTLAVTLEGSPPWSFQYRIDGQNQPNVVGILQSPYNLTVTKTGVYEIIRFTDAHCTGTASGTGTVRLAGAQIAYSLSPPSCPDLADGSISISISEGTPPYDIVWTPSANDPLRLANIPAGTYQIQVTDATGCTSSETIVLASDNSARGCLPYQLFVPNAFSPNNDGFNDDFRFFPSENSNIALVKSLHVFNRWGGVVFEKNNFPPDATASLWDGRFNGKPMDAGVFVWQAVLVLNDGKEVVAVGDMVLVR